MASVLNTLGVTLILFAFVLLQLRKVSAESKVFNLLNCIGGFMSSTGAFLIDAIPFVVLEGVWGLVALLALFRKTTTK